MTAISIKPKVDVITMSHEFRQKMPGTLPGIFSEGSREPKCGRAKLVLGTLQPMTAK